MTKSASGPATSIALPQTDRVTVRGKDLCDEIIGHETFAAYFARLLGLDPSPNLVAMVDATLVAISEHGFVPSIQAARMTYAAAPDALQGAVASGLLGCGSVVLGASETAGILLAEIIAEAERTEQTLDVVARSALTELHAKRQALPGFGHPLHKPEDPRAIRLLEFAESIGVNGKHMAALQAVRNAVPEVYGRHLPLNISAAIPATLLDAGFPLGALKGIPLIARTASLVAHLLEEQARPVGFALSDAGAKAVTYDGEPSEKDKQSGAGGSTQ